MKKLIIILVLLMAGYFLWRSTNKPAELPARSPAAVTSPKAIPQAEAISGSTLNKAFPEAPAGYKLTFSQEKDGFSQADIVQDGKKVGTLTISDTAANPSARDKFKTSTRQIAGFPAAAVGVQGTAVLVGGRYQVQARSAAPSFTAADREAWLGKCKLAALAALARK